MALGGRARGGPGLRGWLGGTAAGRSPILRPGGGNHRRADCFVQPGGHGPGGGRRSPGLWGQGWGLPSRSTYAAQIAALLTAQWSGMPAAALGAWLLWRGRLRATMPPLQALPRYRPNLDRLTRLLTLVIAVAVVLNGLPFWARPRWIGWPRRFVLGKFGVCFRPAAPTD